MKAYNEIRDAKGELRPAYRSFQARTGYDPLDPSPEWISRCFNSPLGDQIQFFPTPLILSEGEYQDVILPGARQRVRAFQHFFRDIAIGGGEILKPGAPLAHMPLMDLFRDQGVSFDHVRDVWAGADENRLRFIYGPDMIRNPAGEWMIIEDNIGIIGGMSEAFHVANAFLTTTGTRLNTQDRLQNDLKLGIEAFLRDAGADGDVSKVIGLMPYDDLVPTLAPFELDSSRKTALLKEMGIASWNMPDLTDAERELALSGGVRAFVNFSSAKWRPKKQFNLDLFKRLKVPMFEAPLIKYTSSKGFLPFMENMVRFYLNEDPILRSPETHLLTEAKLPAEPQNWVLKRADEAEGKGVLVLPRMFPSQLEAAGELLKEWMAGETSFVVVKQRYLPPSYLPTAAPGGWQNFLVDLRPITYAYGFDKIHVSENLNARAISALGDPRNCITRGAMALPVLRERV